MLKKLICIILALLCLFAIPVSALEGPVAKSIYENNPIENGKYKAYTVINTQEDKILDGRNGEYRQPVGNLVKIMVLYMAYEALAAGKIRLDTMVRVPKGVMELKGNTMFLDFYRSETVSVYELMKAMSVNSANDAALTLAMSMAASEQEFVYNMNATAKELGMINTNFTDCTGRDRTIQYTTSDDMAHLVWNLLRKYPQVTELASTMRYTYKHNTGRPETLISNNNAMLTYWPGKTTGLSASSGDTIGYCLACTADLDGEKIICVVLGADDDNNGVALARYAIEKSHREYIYHTVDVAGTYIRRIAVIDGRETSVKAELKDDFRLFIKSVDVDKIKREVLPQEKLTAPIERGDVIGQVRYSINGEEVGTIDMIAAEKVEEASWFTKFVRWFLSLFGIK